MHLGHINVIGYSNRPFIDVYHMNEALINNYNELVQPNDVVYFVGDVCMGKRQETLPLVKRLNGYKILIPGNHDYCHPMHSAYNMEKWKINCRIYEDFFDDIIYDDIYVLNDFILCHLPYNISQDDHADRDFGDYEPMDIGMPLLCGHMHTAWKTKLSEKGSFMLNVGVDAHDYKPITYEQAVDMYKQEIYKD